jgi:hypothetical protein
MKTNGNDKAMESYKIFPFLAWALVIGFSLFVYKIAMDLNDVSQRLGHQADVLERYPDTQTE